MRAFGVVIFILSSLMPILGQPEDTEVFAPFASRLKTLSEGTSILLTWKDSEDVSGINLIYRHSQEITTANIGEAELLARVPFGQGSYRDFPASTDSYYYVVLVEDDEGNRYDLFIPFRNKTIIGSRISSVGTPEEVAATVTEIAAEGTKDGITVSFRSSRADRDLLLFRSDIPMDERSDLVGSVTNLLDRGASSFREAPPAGLDFYYAILDAKMFELGKVQLTPGENSTKVPARIPLSTSTSVSVGTPLRRPKPLPMLVLSSEVESGDSFAFELELPSRQELTPAASKAVAKLLTRFPLKEEAERVVEVLEAETQSSVTGEKYLLATIVAESLSSGNFDEAEERLKSFLSVRRSPEAEARAHFYIGQTYYFRGFHNMAILEFLLAWDFFYSEVNLWLDASFKKLYLQES
jgi:hypothetical protein